MVKMLVELIGILLAIAAIGGGLYSRRKLRSEYWQGTVVGSRGRKIWILAPSGEVSSVTAELRRSAKNDLKTGDYITKRSGAMKPEVESHSLDELDKENRLKVLEAAKEAEPSIALHKSRMTRRKRIAIAIIVMSPIIVLLQFRALRNEAARRDMATEAMEHLKKGLAYQAGGELDKSIEELEKAIEIKPDLAQAHSMIVRVYTMQGNEEKAIAHCREFIRLASASDDPGLKNRIPEMQVRICVMQGDEEKAIIHFKEFVRLASDDPFMRIRISELQSLMKKLEGDKQ